MNNFLFYFVYIIINKKNRYKHSGILKVLNSYPFSFNISCSSNILLKKSSSTFGNTVIILFLHSKQIILSLSNGSSSLTSKSGVILKSTL